MAVAIRPDAPELIEKLHTLATLESERGYLEFLSHVIVDAQPKKLPFRKIAEGWQWDRARRSAPALNNLAGITDNYTGPKSFWNGYHKGSDKTHDDARELCWLLGWSKRRLKLYVCAGSEDQAALITEAMKGIVQDNKWIGERVRVTDLTASGVSGSELNILSMNAYTSQGVFPDYLVASEVTHWMYDEGRKFWDFILASVNKRPHCVLKVETNAGHKGSWQWEERNRIAESPYWSFFEAPVGLPLATWMNQAKIDDDSQGMEPGERDRLYKNRWIDPGEENGYLTLEDAEKCVCVTMKEETGRDPFRRDLQYIASLDYGGVTDRAAMCVMHGIPATDMVDVDRLDCWQGSHADRIDINKPPPGSEVRRSIEEWLEVSIANFGIRTIVLDPMQLEGLAILYERKGFNVIRFEYRSGKGNHRMAQLLKASVQNRKVRWSPQAGLLPGKLNGKIVEDRTFSQELAMLIIKRMAYGYRFDHESGRHDDRAVCVGMGLCHLLPEVPPGGNPGPRVVENKDEYGRILQPNMNEAVGRWNLYGVKSGNMDPQRAWDKW